jgi:hypothetical protein
MPKWLLAPWIAERVLYFGDSSMLPAVARGLARLPAAVRQAAMEECAWLGVGAESSGWTGSSNLLDQDGERRERLVVLSGAAEPHEIERCAVHEAGHVWVSALPHAHSALISARGERRLYSMARADGWLSRAEGHVARDERLASALEWIWTAR